MKDSAPPLPTVLILGGTPPDQAELGRALTSDFDCLTAQSADEAMALMSEQFVQVVISAGAVAGADRIEVIEGLLGQWPETMLVQVGDAPAPLRSKDNLQQVLGPSWTSAQVHCAVSAAARAFSLSRENARLALEMRFDRHARPSTRRESPSLGFENILRAPGSPMASVIETARQYASFDVPVLLLGEAGTGKAALARAIHDSSLRSDQSFQALDVTGLSDATAQLALFGRRKAGNGTPPMHKHGLIHKADRGTLLIAGLDTLSRDVQMRLLRLAREGLFEPDGTDEPERSDARLIMATCADPQQSIAAGTLDPALYYAMSTAELALPPLRARKADLPLLARAVADEAAHLHGKMLHGISDAAMGFLTAYTWPGNLWELENEITRMLILAQDPLLGPELISRRILQAAPGVEDMADDGIMTATGPLKHRVEAIEARILRETLTRLRWNKSRSAAELGLSRVGLRAKLDRYGICPPQTEEA